MTREITHEENGPKPITEEDLGDDGAAYICQCGLSENQPFCDGSHNVTADEEDGTVYKYDNDDSDGERHEIDEITYKDD